MDGSFIENLAEPQVLYNSWRAVWKKSGAPGCDGVRVQDFQRKETSNILSLSAEILSARYQPSPLRQTFIPKSTPGKWRRLSIPTVKDRIVQQAAHHLLQKIYDKSFAPCSFAYRPGRSINEAVARVRQGITSGLPWAVRGDIRGCFDEIDRDILSVLLKNIIPDQQFLSLINKSIRAPVINKGYVKNLSKGIPQGSPLSPFLSNLYLHQFDVPMLSAGIFIIRFADDWIALAPDFVTAERILIKAMNAFTRLHISLNREKSGILNLSHTSTIFLGHRMSASAIDADNKGWKRAYDAAARYRCPENRDDYIRARADLLGIQSMYSNSGSF